MAVIIRQERRHDSNSLPAKIKAFSIKHFYSIQNGLSSN